MYTLTGDWGYLFDFSTETWHLADRTLLSDAEQARWVAELPAVDDDGSEF